MTWDDAGAGTQQRSSISMRSRMSVQEHDSETYLRALLHHARHLQPGTYELRLFKALLTRLFKVLTHLRLFKALLYNALRKQALSEQSLQHPLRL
jgi:hypothetical protein